MFRGWQEIGIFWQSGLKGEEVSSSGTTDLDLLGPVFSRPEGVRTSNTRRWSHG